MKLLKTRSAAFVLSNVLRGALVLAPAAALLLLQTPAHAQQGAGNITGTVRDASTKAPLADVVVTATAPQMQGEQTVVTDSSGSFRLPALPPGDYTLHLDKEGYKPGGRGGITLKIDATIRVNMDLLPEGLKAEEIVVVGKAPVVDVGSSSTGVNVNSDFTSRIPLNPPSGRNAASHSFEDVALVAPGAHADDYGVSISGTTSPENQYLVDGLSVNDPAYGINATPMNLEFIDQVNVITGGYLPEFGRATGGILDVVTKSGSNEYHGSVFFNITPGGLEGGRTQVLSGRDSINYQYPLSSLRDFGATVGGPIVKDKLWFFTGVDFAFTRYRILKQYNYFDLDKNGNQVIDPKTGFATTHPILDANGNPVENTYYADGRNIQVFAKLTYNINQDNHLALSFLASPQRSGGDGTYGIDNQLQGPQALFPGNYGGQAEEFSADSYDTSLKYTSSWDNKKWLLDATVGWHHEHTGRQPSDGSGVGANNPNNLSGQSQVFWQRSDPSPHSLTEFENFPGASTYCKTVAGQPTCPVGQYVNGGPGFTDDALLDRYQGKAVLTRLFQAAGHHVLKAGVDVELMSYEHKSAYTGGQIYQEGSDGSYFLSTRQYGILTAPDDASIYDYYDSKSHSTTVGGFVQDSWSIADRVTLNVGLRYDGQFVFGTDSGRTGINLPNEWSPRIGFVWDPTHEGKAKIFGNFARFYEGVPLDIADRTFPGQSELVALYDAGVCSHPEGPQGSSHGGACQQNSARFPINSGTSPTQRFSPYAADTEAVDPNLKPQSSDEWVAGGEYEIFEDATIGLSYTHRYQNAVVEDMSNDEGVTFFVGNPGYGIASNFPKAVRDYDAVTFYFTKAFSHGWLTQASYTIASLRGNWSGLYRPDTLQLDPNINSDFDLRSLLPNRSGPLPGDRTHQIKLFAAKDWNLPQNLVIQTGGTFSARSGDPTSYLGAHVQYGPHEVYILPRGDGERLPWVFDVDAHVGLGYRISKDSTILVGMDVFNLFDFQAVTSRDEDFTLQPVLPLSGGKPGDLAGCKGPTAKGACPLIDPTTNKPWAKSGYNPNFGNATSYQAPREFRFSAKVTF